MDGPHLLVERVDGVQPQSQEHLQKMSGNCRRLPWLM